ncbi:hypothetical protein K438DRAFT_1779992 [Mycena galopus ATCC 62051]|nr:hypothetical protein K438DRAFT_1779992 [Mycena galopus ATCC 62051]
MCRILWHVSELQDVLLCRRWYILGSSDPPHGPHMCPILQRLRRYAIVWTHNPRTKLVASKTVDSIRLAKRERRQKYEQNKTVKHTSGNRSLPSKEAIQQATADAKQSFSFIVATHLYSIATQWQEEMNPTAWLPAPGDVCGRQTRKTGLTPVNPLHYNTSDDITQLLSQSYGGRLYYLSVRYPDGILLTASEIISIRSASLKW